MIYKELLASVGHWQVQFEQCCFPATKLSFRYHSVIH